MVGRVLLTSSFTFSKCCAVEQFAFLHSVTLFALCFSSLSCLTVATDQARDAQHPIHSFVTFVCPVFKEEQEDGHQNPLCDGAQHKHHHRRLSQELYDGRTPRHPEPEGIQTDGEERSGKLYEGEAWLVREEVQSVGFRKTTPAPSIRDSEVLSLEVLKVRHESENCFVEHLQCVVPYSEQRDVEMIRGLHYPSVGDTQP